MAVNKKSNLLECIFISKKSLEISLNLTSQIKQLSLTHFVLIVTEPNLEARSFYSEYRGILTSRVHELLQQLGLSIYQSKCLFWSKMPLGWWFCLQCHFFEGNQMLGGRHSVLSAKFHLCLRPLEGFLGWLTYRGQKGATWALKYTYHCDTEMTLNLKAEIGE